MESRHFRVRLLFTTFVVGFSLIFSSCASKPEIIRFEANPMTIRNPGDISTLIWDTENASSVNLSGIGSVPPSGRREVRPSGPTTYVLTAINADGETTRTLDVSVVKPSTPPPPPPPPGGPKIVSFIANPPEITSGGASILEWNTENTSSVSISGIGSVPPRGSKEVRPSAATTYVLTATNTAGQTISASAQVTMRPSGRLGSLRINTFRANPPEITSGGASILEWNTENTSSVSISGIGSVPPRGSKEVRPSAATTYVLTATNAAGQAISASIQVTMKPAPPGPPRIVTFRLEPPSITDGGEAKLIWDTQHASSVSISENIGPVKPSDSKIVKPERSTNYVITAMNAAGETATRNTGVEVLYPLLKEPPPRQLPHQIKPITPSKHPTPSNPERRMTVKWNAVRYAASYTVEVDCFGCCGLANKWCTEVGKEFMKISSIGTTEYTLEFKVPAQRGRWRVWAADQKGRAGVQSGWQEFSLTH
jgi:eukaryotic-like serine/threonine-protein kinase